MQSVEPSVSRAKFDREVADYREIEPTLVARGWWLMKADFPIVEVGFITVHMRPAMLLFAVRLDFTNYDVEPLSVRFIDPFSGQMLAIQQLPVPLARIDPAMTATQVTAAMQGLEAWGIQNLAQGHGTEPAFLCLPGVREYHAHSAHSGDPWELHRAGGEGKMFNILEKVWRYGTDPYIAMNFTSQFQAREIPR